MNKAVLLQLQQARVKAAQELEMRTNMRHIYDNLSYDDSETKEEPDSNTINCPADDRRPSKTNEKMERRKDMQAPEVKIDSF